MKTNKPLINRRDFIKKSSILASISILPSYLALGKKSSSGILPPSEKVNLAMVGFGNKGDRNRQAFLKTGLCNIVALYDVHPYGSHTLFTRQSHQLASINPDSKAKKIPTEFYDKARIFTNLHEMFEKMENDIDAVVVSTPDHSHFAAAMLAMSYKKHVWVEKPLAHTFAQCERLMDLAKRSEVVTQMGNQGHSGANYFQFEAWQKAGIIKDITQIDAFMNKYRRWHGWGESVTKYPNEQRPQGLDWDAWCNSAPDNPYSKKLHPGNWRSWFDYGCGALGDWGAHIIDAPHRFLKLGMPEKITATKREGANKFVFPQASTLEFDFPAREDMPACKLSWYDGQENIPNIDLKYGNIVDAPPKKTPLKLNPVGKILYSKNLTFLGGSHSDPLRIIPKDKYLDMRHSLPRFAQKNSNHWENFLLSCKGEEKTRSPFHVSAPLSQVLSLGVLSQRFGGTLKFDRKTKQITNNREANAMLDPTPRKGWEEYYKL